MMRRTVQPDGTILVESVELGIAEVHDASGTIVERRTLAAPDRDALVAWAAARPAGASERLVGLPRPALPRPALPRRALSDDTTTEEPA